MEQQSSNSDELIQAAVEARTKAYAPYSGYKVGAAIRDKDGNIWTGCNVENVSYGVSICAERSAICRMITEGSNEIREVAVATRDGGTPCGMCLQALLEFAPDTKAVIVKTFSEAGELRVHSLHDLIPLGFASFGLKRTETES